MASDVDTGDETRAVIDRLNGLRSSAIVSFDRARAERALANHLGVLGLEPRSVRWVEDEQSELGDAANARAGFMAAWKERDSAPGLVSSGDPAFELLQRFEQEAGRAEKKADRAVRREAKKAGAAANERADRAVSVIGEGQTIGRGLSRALEERSGGEKAGAWVGDKLARGWLGAPGAFLTGGLSRESVAAREIVAASGADKARRAASWVARAEALRSAGQGDPAVDRMGEIYLPFIDAVEAGLWLYWITQDAVLAVRVPEAEGDAQALEGATAAPRTGAADSYVSSLCARLEDEEFEDWSRLARRAGAESFWRRTELQVFIATEYEIFVAVRHSTRAEATPEALSTFSRTAFELSLQQKLSEWLVLSYAVLVVDSVPPELREFVTKLPAKDLGVFEFPVAVDLSSKEVLRPIQLREDFSRLADRLFRPG